MYSESTWAWKWSSCSRFQLSCPSSVCCVFRVLTSHLAIYQLYRVLHVYISPLLTFLKFLAPSLKSYRTSYTSVESPIIELFESGKKLGIVSSWGWPRPTYWKSTTFTKTCLEPSMTALPPISKLVSCTTIQGFLKTYITLSSMNWLRNDKSSKFNEEKESHHFY